MISEKVMNANYKSIMIPCKSYVKRYMIQNFGDPINLYSVRNPYTLLFRRCLENPCRRNEARMLGNKLRKQAEQTVTLTTANTPYSEVMEFMISDYDFYHFGWEMTLTDFSILHSTMEHAAKAFMRTCISVDYSISGCLAQSIRRFQNLYEYPDHIWSFDAIKKDLDRNIIPSKIDFEDELYLKIQTLLMNILSKSGTISPSNLKRYEPLSERSKQHRRNCQNLVIPGIGDPFTSI